MIKSTILFLSTSILLFAVTAIKPAQQINVGGLAKDAVADSQRIYVGTDAGVMKVYNYISKKFEEEIKFPDIKDFMGDIVPTRVSSVDVLNGRYIMLTDSGIGGYVNIWLHENNSTRKLISHEEKKVITKIRFVDDNHILFGYLSDEAALYDIKNKKEIYRVQLSPSKFSDFALNNDRSRAAFGCESGVITVIDVKTGKTIIKLSGVNKDNTYKVDYKNGIVSGAGQDRIGSIYEVTTGKGDGIHGDFLIYATGLSPSADRVAFAMDEQNNIHIYKTSTKSKQYILKGQKSTLNSIVFIDEDTIVSASDDNTVMLWKLK